MAEAEKLHNDKEEDKSTKGKMERLLEEFRKGKKEANITTTSNKSSVTQSSFTNKVIHADKSDEDRSVVSAITRNTIT